METQLVIFLAFTSVTLTVNTLIIWFAYKAFAKVTDKVSDSVSEFQKSGTTRSWLNALDVAASQAATVTGTAKEQVEAFEPRLAHAQSVFGYGLAKVDVRFENLCDNISMQVEKAQMAIVRPAHRIGASAAGIRELAQFMGALENNADTGPISK